MAVTQVNYTGNNSTTNYSFTFPYLDKTDVKVRIDGTTQPTTAYSFANATTIAMDTAPSTGAKIVIFRDTNNDSKKGSFYAGSAIKAEDLNDNFDQILYTAQEVDNNAFQASGATPMTGDIQLADGTGVVFEGTTDDAFETTLKAVDPTADRAINLPNVSGTVVTTGDTGTVTSTMIADATIVNADIANTTITGGKLVNDTITATQIAANAVTASELADDAVDRNAIVNDAVNGTKIADDSIDSEHYVDGSIDAIHIANNTITATQLAADSVGASELANDSVASANIIDGSIINADINASAGIVGTKLANDTITATQIATNAITANELADDAVDQAAIAANAVTTVKIATDAVTATQIADNAVERGQILNDAVNGSKIADDSIDSEHYVDASIDQAHLAANSVGTTQLKTDSVTADIIAANSVTTSEIADAELTTLAGMQSATASILAAGTNLTATLAEINSVCDGKAPQTTISDDDTKYPTSGAVVDYVAAQIAPIGGLEVIATDAAFPNTQPASGVVISISDAGGVVFNGSGTSTTGRTVGSSTVTINNAPSSLNSETLAAGVGLMVSSTGAGQIYNYHKILGKEDDIKQLSDDINDFNARYRVNAGEPSSNNDEGDLVYDTNANKMKVYDGSAWGEVTSTGDFKYLFLCPAGGSGAPTLNGSIATYDLREGSNTGSAASVTSAAQLLVSVDGVVQKANTGTSAPSEGFALVDSNTIIFGSNLASGSSVFIVQSGSALTINVPGDNTVATAKIQNGAVITDKLANLAVNTTKLAADSVDASKISDDAIGAEHIQDNAIDLAAMSHGTQGDVLYYGSGGAPTRLGAGTSGHFLKTQGGSANPVWAAVPAGITLSGSTDNTVCTVTGANAMAGEANLTFDGNKLTAITGSNDSRIIHSKNTTSDGALVHYTNSSTGHATGDGFITGIGSDESGYLWHQENSPILFGTNNSERARFTSDGNLNFENDSSKIQLGTGQDLQIFHNGSLSTIQGVAGSGGLNISSDETRIISPTGENKILATANGAVKLYYDHSLKFETTTNGWKCADNIKGVFGNSDDLQIYHASNDYSYIKDSSGRAYIQSSRVYIQNAAGTENMIYAEADAGVNLYYNGNPVLQTTVNALHLTGNASESNIKLMTSDGTQRGLIGSTNGGEMYCSNQASEKIWDSDNNGEFAAYYDNSKKFQTTSNGAKVGDICEFNDSSQGRLIVGTIGPGTSTTIDSESAMIQCNRQHAGRGGILHGLSWGGGGPRITLGHSGSTTVGTHSVTSSGTSMGTIIFTGDDGDEFARGAQIVGIVDGTPGNDDMPGRLSFYVSADGTKSPTERFRISNNGDLTATDTSIGSLSDERLKKNIADFTYDLSKFKSFKPRTFEWKNTAYHSKDTGIRGFVAQELESTDNYWVTEQKIADEHTEDLALVEADKKAKIGKLGQKDAMYVSVIQQLITKIETLETKVAALEAA